MKVRPKIVCLMGPTASGKTHLAMQLVSHFPMQIINVDSALVYRGMNIGTAKPSRDELTRVPHRLLDICDPSESYSAGRFCKEALHEIETILAHNQIPLLVGGTMLYFRMLQFGVASLPEADPSIRTEIEANAKKQGWQMLHAQLAKVDPPIAKQLHPHDSQRITRALEVYRLTGEPLSKLQTKQLKTESPYEFINLALAPKDRSVLHARIEKRFHLMLKQGFIDEVKKLCTRGDLHANSPSMRTVGYRQIWAYLEGEYDDETMIQKSVAATRQLARRQLIWLRRWPNVQWFDSMHSDVLNQVIYFLREKLQDDRNSH